MDSNDFNRNPSPYSNTGGYPSPDYSNPYGNNPVQRVKAPNILEQFAYAFVPPKYGILTKAKVGSMIGFVVLLTLLATILSAVKFFIAFSLIGSSSLGLLEDLPDFGVKNDRFFIDEEYVFDDDGMFVYLTDEIDEFTYDDVDYAMELGYSEILLVGRDNISIMNNGQYQEMRFKDLDLGEDITIDKEWIKETLMPILSIIMVVVYVFFFIFRALWYFFSAMLYFLVALAVAAIMQRNVSAGALYRTAVYSKVLMFVVGMALGLLPFVHISVPGIINIVITIAFMSFAIYMLPKNV
ncbi:MAG: DUF1189 domain-containing protein [Butyrivibrio sp.]|nr:DUF1189 domain-containing protein [Muribaculum sp.]MCM1551386.1 DUF1189 domain-containing protein [Butyrivibrio sp.]